MNRTPLARPTQIINALVEGNSIRSTERMTNTHRDTVMRLVVEVGEGCARIMDEKMHNLPCQRIQVDEIWSYVRKKQAHLKPGESVRAGDFWTFVAIDPQTKLVPSYLVGKRMLQNATTFMSDLSQRLSIRIQLSSGALKSYEDAVETAFGVDVDYGQIVKFYDSEPIGPGALQPAARDRCGANGHRRVTRSATHFDKPSRASKSDHAQVDASVLPPDQRLQQEGG